MRINSFRKSFLILALLASLLIPAAAGAATVTVLCSPNIVWCDVIKEEFPKATGIDLEYIRLSSGEALARLRAERDNPSFDVWFGGTGDPHFVANSEGLTEFYRPTMFDDLSTDLTVRTGEAYLPLYAGILGWAVNDGLLQEMGVPVPKTWKDLADPAYRELIAIANPNTSGTSYTTLATILQIYGEEEGWEIIHGMHLNMAQYARSGAAPALLAGRGEVAIGIVFLHDALDHVIQGFPLSARAPKTVRDLRSAGSAWSRTPPTGMWRSGLSNGRSPPKRKSWRPTGDSRIKSRPT